jgi:hypothetical protein
VTLIVNDNRSNTQLNRLSNRISSKINLPATTTSSSSTPSPPPIKRKAFQPDFM